MQRGGARSAAARRFKVAVSSAIKWTKRFEETGSFAEKPGRKLVYSPLEAHADWLLAFVAGRPDATLAETVAALQGERGLKTTDSSVSRFFKRRGITFKKTRRTPATSGALMSPRPARRGRRRSRRLIRPSSSSSTRPGPTRK